MNRGVAYLLIGFAGFVIGSILYYLSVFIIPGVIEMMPAIQRLITSNQQAFGMIASGMVGAIIAVISAHLWARSGI